MVNNLTVDFIITPLVGLISLLTVSFSRGVNFYYFLKLIKYL